MPPPRRKASATARNRGDAVTPTPISRRGFLVVGLSAVVLAGCTARPGPRATPNTAPSTPSPSPTPSPTPSRPPAPTSVAELLAQPRFAVAHRGSGDNWPEH